MSGFDEAYAGTPPWDIGRPQLEIVRLAEAGEIRGSVLDVGCGTGEHALYLAERGHEVLGVDLAPVAIDRAWSKADRRRLKVKFLRFDALALEGLGRSFDTVMDVGLFHNLSDEERPIYARGVGAVLNPGGRFFLMCFSDLVPGKLGPRRVSQEEIRAVFAQGWKVRYIREAIFESLIDNRGVAAWLACLTRAEEQGARMRPRGSSGRGWRR